MANHRGSEGSVKVGTATIAEVTAWSLEESAATIDDSTLDDTVTTMQIGRTSSQLYRNVLNMISK